MNEIKRDLCTVSSNDQGSSQEQEESSSAKEEELPPEETTSPTAVSKSPVEVVATLPTHNDTAKGLHNSDVPSIAPYPPIPSPSLMVYFYSIQLYYCNQTQSFKFDSIMIFKYDLVRMIS